MQGINDKNDHDTNKWIAVIKIWPEDNNTTISH
jgi:hypothetical protein